MIGVPLELSYALIYVKAVYCKSGIKYLNRLIHTFIYNEIKRTF